MRISKYYRFISIVSLSSFIVFLLNFIVVRNCDNNTFAYYLSATNFIYILCTYSAMSWLGLEALLLATEGLP